MVNYRLVVDGEAIDLKTVSNQSWGGEQEIIVFESPGTNGGVIINTGRRNRRVALTGRIRHQEGRSLEDIKNEIQEVMEAGKVVTLVAPIQNNDTGRYQIRQFTGNVLEGVESYLPFTIVLEENRQVNTQRSQVNLINFDASETFKQRLRDRGLLA